MGKHKEPDHTFGYEHNGSEVLWDVKDLWEAVERLPTVRLEVKHFQDAIKNVQKGYEADDWVRIDEANTDYPIIVGEKKAGGYLIMDGLHRLGKLVKLKEQYVYAKVLKRMPTPYLVKGKPFEIDGLNFKWESKQKRSNSLEHLKAYVRQQKRVN